MESIKEIYKIGYGPSSSHTMAPAKACMHFLSKLKFDTVQIRVYLYNSLALTGDGHLTHTIIRKIFHGYHVDIINEFDDNKHPNYFEIRTFSPKVNKGLSINYTSIGGGDLLINGKKPDLKEIYPHKTFNEIKKYCKENKLHLYDYVYKFEGENIKDYLYMIYHKMCLSVDNGLKKTGLLPGKLEVVRKANTLYNLKAKFESPEIYESRIVSSFAFAVAEENASGGQIVTAPTCGACGVVPAVIRYMDLKYKFIKKERIINAMAVIGLIGNIIKNNATISGAVGGCQAEIGSACAMAAAGHATLFNLSIEQVEYAAEIALEHQLGLTCDPVMGYVQIPCIERNAVAALRAIASCGLAFFLSNTRKISLDTVIKTMYQTGLDLNTKYKETACGGLAVYFNKNSE